MSEWEHELLSVSVLTQEEIADLSSVYAASRPMDRLQLSWIR